MPRHDPIDLRQELAIGIAQINPSAKVEFDSIPDQRFCGPTFIG